MPQNTQARAHVHGALLMPTISDDSDLDTSISRTASGSESEEEEYATLPLSRKETRRLKKLKNSHELDIDASTAAESNLQKTALRNNQTKDQAAKLEPTSTPNSIPRSLQNLMSKKYYPLLVCSIGNPGAQYAKSLHSAGHTILQTIQEESRGLYTPFTKGLSGLVSRPNTTHYRAGIFSGFTKHKDQDVNPEEQNDFTLWQSTSLMNISGKGVKNAWTKFHEEQRQKGLEARLVVVHDELESELGKVSIKDGAASAKGHNGLKSIQASLGSMKWWRVAVGIGRPESREPNVVSQFVLRKMTEREEKKLYYAANTVVNRLEEIANGKR